MDLCLSSWGESLLQIMFKGHVNRHPLEHLRTLQGTWDTSFSQRVWVILSIDLFPYILLRFFQYNSREKNRIEHSILFSLLVYICLSHCILMIYLPVFASTDFELFDGKTCVWPSLQLTQWPLNGCESVSLTSLEDGWWVSLLDRWGILHTPQVPGLELWSSLWGSTFPIR